jgi:hypothetical protein
MLMQEQNMRIVILCGLIVFSTASVFAQDDPKPPPIKKEVSKNTTLVASAKGTEACGIELMTTPHAGQWYALLPTNWLALS